MAGSIYDDIDLKYDGSTEPISQRHHQLKRTRSSTKIALQEAENLRARTSMVFTQPPMIDQRSIGTQAEELLKRKNLKRLVSSQFMSIDAASKDAGDAGHSEVEIRLEKTVLLMRLNMICINLVNEMVELQKQARNVTDPALQEQTRFYLDLLRKELKKTYDVFKMVQDRIDNSDENGLEEMRNTFNLRQDSYKSKITWNKQEAETLEFSVPRQVSTTSTLDSDLALI